MGKAVLVTEGDSPLGAALLRLFSAKGFSVVTTSSSAGPSQGAAGAKAISWNRRSALSARNVLVTALNSLDALDEAYLLEPPCPSIRPLSEISSAEIEQAYDDAKGPVFLARELLSYFAGRASGLLAMVSFSSSGTALASGLREGFRGFAGSILSSPAAAGIVVNGFQSLGDNAEEFAAFIDRTLEEKARRISGHWFVLQPRGGFLQGVFSPQVRKASLP